jgi:hypothetical protein
LDPDLKLLEQGASIMDLGPSGPKLGVRSSAPDRRDLARRVRLSEADLRGLKP